MTGYISEAAFFVELLQSCFYRGNITNDAVFGQYGQHFAKSVQRVLYCHGIYDQFGLKFLNLLQCGETIRVIDETQLVRVDVEHGRLMLKAQYVSKEGAHFAGSED